MLKPVVVISAQVRDLMKKGLCLRAFWSISIVGNLLNNFVLIFFKNNLGNNLYFNSNQNLDVSIYGIDGKLISILKLQSETGKVNLDFLEKGVYILKYFIEGANYYKRIIKN